MKDFLQGRSKNQHNLIFSLKYYKMAAVMLCLLFTNCQKKGSEAPKPVNHKPVANFLFKVTANGTLPCTVNFSDSSQYADTYKWYFDDGNLSTAKNPDNTYNVAKTYHVKLVVSNSFGKDSITKALTIILNKPKAGFTATVVDNGNLPTTVNFANTSVGADAFIWTFDDGTQSALLSPVVKYTKTKTYNVKLVAINASGKDSITQAVPITINKPKADFSFSFINEGSMPCSVAFTDNSVGGQTYKWYFGDGNVSSAQNPQNTYKLSKKFSVKLVVANTEGKDSLVKEITIKPLDYSVRIFLITPTDRQFNQKYYDVLKTTALHLQSWYKQQMGGKTFVLNNPMIDTLRGKHSYNWYNQYNGTYSGTDPRFYGFNNTLYEIQQVIGTLDFHLYLNAVYVAAPGGGAGSTGICALGDQDLDGLLGINQSDLNVNRWIGGSGHEWGHGFGLSHPENQDGNAIMWTGYTVFPNCYLLQADKDILNTNKLFK